MNKTAATHETVAPTPRPDGVRVASTADGAHDLVAMRAGIQGGPDIER